MQPRSPLLAALLLLPQVWSASVAAGPADKSAFLARERMYVTIEVTLKGDHKPGTGTPADALMDGGFHRNRWMKTEIPLDMAVPGAFPPSSRPLSQTEMLEEGRFIGWMAAPPEDSGDEEALTTGKLDPAKSSMFLPAQFSVDDIELSLFRDNPKDRFGTKTSVIKGRGTAYIARSGMLSCDMRNMTCDLNNVLLHFNEIAPQITSDTTWDVPGFTPTHETQALDGLVPTPTEALSTRLSAIPITFTDPIVLTLSDPAAGGSGPPPEQTVTMKVTLSKVASPKAAAPR